MSTRHRYRRANLFLLRIWSEDAADGSSEPKWRGRVQRVTDGESHEFSSWQNLAELLLAMLPTDGGAKPLYTQSESGTIRS